MQAHLRSCTVSKSRENGVLNTVRIIIDCHITLQKNNWCFCMLAFIIVICFVNLCCESVLCTHIHTRIHTAAVPCSWCASIVFTLHTAHSG